MTKHKSRTATIGLIIATILFLPIPGCNDDSDGGKMGSPADPACSGGVNNVDRFVDCGNGTVTDSDSGFLWLKDAGCLGEGRDWGSATDWAESLADGDCGLTDNSSPGAWRLPTKEEWEAVLNPGCNPSISDSAGTGCRAEGDPFSLVQPDFYWSSSRETIGNSTWAVDLTHGATVLSDPRVGFEFRVWPVRDGS